MPAKVWIVIEYDTIMSVWTTEEAAYAERARLEAAVSDRRYADRYTVEWHEVREAP